LAFKDILEIIRFNQTGKQPKDTVAKISFEKVFDLTLKIKTYEPQMVGVAVLIIIFRILR